MATWARQSTSGLRPQSQSSSTAKPDLPSSRDPIFRGDANVYNPEDLFVASRSSCHLCRTALCARSKITSSLAMTKRSHGCYPDRRLEQFGRDLRPKVRSPSGGDESARSRCTDGARHFVLEASSTSVLHEPQIESTSIVNQLEVDGHRSVPEVVTA